MERFQFWQRWLLGISIIVSIFGVLMAFLNGTALFATFDGQTNPVFWGTAIPAGVAEFQGWVYGVMGAMMAGWGIFMAFIAHYPFKSKERWAWLCVASGISLWFVIDTAISLYFGVRFNAVFNTLLFVLIMLPVVFTRKEFSGKG